MTKYFVDVQGNYLGGFDGAEPPGGAIEVPNPPAYGGDKWINGAWVEDATHAAALARDAGIDTAISSDTTIAQLKAMTSAEFDTWWTANVTNLAQANNVLKRLARVVLRRLC